MTILPATAPMVMMSACSPMDDKLLSIISFLPTDMPKENRSKNINSKMILPIKVILSILRIM